MKQLVLIRHGQSLWNRERRIQGQSGPGLTDTGRSQAARTAEWVAATHPDAVVRSSDLPRCVETAAPIAEALGAEVCHRPQLRERAFGDWTGRLVRDVEVEEAERFARWTEGEDVIPEVGGESSEELSARVVRAFDAVLEELPPSGLAVVVTHGGPVWHGTQAFLDLPEDRLGPVANASVTHLAVGDRWGRRLLGWNQVSHLPPTLQTWLRGADVAAEDTREDAGARAGPASSDERAEAPPAGR